MSTKIVNQNKNHRHPTAGDTVLISCCSNISHVHTYLKRKKYDINGKKIHKDIYQMLLEKKAMSSKYALRIE